MYSWGMILYQMLSGHPPFVGFDGLSACRAAAKGDRPAPPGGVAPKLKELLRTTSDETASKRPPFSAMAGDNNPSRAAPAGSRPYSSRNHHLKRTPRYCLPAWIHHLSKRLAMRRVLNTVGPTALQPSRKA